MANHRRRGHNYERQIVNELKDYGYEVVTSRAESRNMDNKGVDIFGNIPCHIQCKNSKMNIDVGKLLTSELLPKDKPTVVFHKKTKKAKENFLTLGEFVYLDKDFFYKLLNHYASKEDK